MPIKRHPTRRNIGCDIEDYPRAVLELVFTLPGDAITLKIGDEIAKNILPLVLTDLSNLGVRIVNSDTERVTIQDIGPMMLSLEGSATGATEVKLRT